MKTPRSREMRGVEERPPPTRTLKPSRSPPSALTWRVAGVRAGGNRNLVLARQVKVGAVVQEVVIDLVQLRPAVEEFLRVEAGDRAAGDVADHVAAAAERCQPDTVQCGEDFGQILD